MVTHDSKSDLPLAFDAFVTLLAIAVNRFINLWTERLQKQTLETLISKSHFCFFFKASNPGQKITFLRRQFISCHHGASNLFRLDGVTAVRETGKFILYHWKWAVQIATRLPRNVCAATWMASWDQSKLKKSNDDLTVGTWQIWPNNSNFCKQLIADFYHQRMSLVSLSCSEPNFASIWIFEE